MARKTHQPLRSPNDILMWPGLRQLALLMTESPSLPNSRLQLMRWHETTGNINQIASVHVDMGVRVAIFILDMKQIPTNSTDHICVAVEKIRRMFTRQIGAAPGDGAACRRK